MKWELHAGIYLLCVALFFLVPWVEDPSPASAVLSAATALLVVLYPVLKRRQELAARLFLYAGLTATAYVSLSFFALVFSNTHGAAVLSQPVAWVFQILGYGASGQNGFVFLSDEGTSVQVTVDAEKLGLAHWATLVTVYVAGACFLGGTLRRIAALIILSSIYLCVRFAFLISAYLFARDFNWNTEHLNFFWSAPYLAATLAPIAVLAGLVLRPLRWDLSASGWRRAGKVGLLAGFATFCFQAMLWLDLPGGRKEGRVLLDDFYSGVWEPSTIPFTTTDYGRESVYNMWLARQYLNSFFSIAVNSKEIRPEDLAGRDVLVIKTPIYRLDDEATDAIEEFVRSGGGLVLIGDHTDLMGMTSHLNELASRFGFEFHADATYDLTTGHDNTSEPLAVFRPAISRALSGVRMLTTCTMNVDFLEARPAAWVRKSIADEVDYSRPSFFGEMEVDLADEFGSFVIGASRKVGAGRVIAFCESTIFSNFAVSINEREELLRKLIEFANRTNDPWEARFRLAALILFLAASVSAVVLCVRTRSHRECLSIGVGLLAGALGGAILIDSVAADLSSSNASPPNRIYFVRDGSDYELPDPMAHYHGDDEDAYDTVFVNIARTGLMPKELDRFTRDIPVQSPIAFIRPDRSAFSIELLDWVRAGGRLLVFGGVERAYIESIFPDSKPLPSRSRQAELRAADYGAGRVVIVAPAESFSRLEVGDVMKEPSDAATAILGTMYDAVEALGRTP